MMFIIREILCRLFDGGTSNFPRAIYHVLDTMIHLGPTGSDAYSEIYTGGEKPASIMGFGS